jgi:dihydroorotase
MQKTILIKNATLVNEGKTYFADVYIKNGIIEKIDTNGISMQAEKIINAEGLHLFPGVIDDQVHFREPGLTHKGELYTEAKAAVAGGVTSYMEMPNTVPSATTIELLEQKYDRAAQVSLANYSFYMGTTNHNLEQLLRVNPQTVCGIKIFMGSSTGDMLVDDPQSLENIFSQIKLIITTHCEDDPRVKKNTALVRSEIGENATAEMHPIIRDTEACYLSSSYAVGLAKKYGTRLHILHISTAKELQLFRNDIPLNQKHITAEACIHHLWFSDADYKTKGNLIKWNPAVKTATDRDAIFAAVLDGRIDVIATDHAPHTLQEKQNPYFDAPSGGPLIQHSLLAMLDFYHQGRISLEMIAKKMCHNVAELFEIDRRGFIREGYHADLVLVNLKNQTNVTPESLLYKCGWSPFTGHTFNSSIHSTFVNGHLVYNQGHFDETQKGMRMRFNR